MKKPPGKGHSIGSKPSKPSVHPAITEIRLGRGYGIHVVPVVDFVRFAGTKALHVNGAHGALCGTKKGGAPQQTIVDCDPKAVMVLGKPVCVRCRKLLGPVPMPRLVKDQGEQ